MVTNLSRRVVITGVGVVSPLGNDPHQLISALRNRESGIRPLSHLPTEALKLQHGAEAIDFTGDIEDYGPLEKTLQRTIRKGSKLMCREIEMGVAVAQLAMTDARLTPENRDRDRIGVVYGCDYIMSLPEEFAEGIRRCLDADQKFHFDRWAESGLPHVNPLWLLKYLPNMPASHVAIYNDLRGPNNSITLREASSGAAVGEAFSTIQRGHADILIVGSTGSRIHTLRTLHASMQENLASDQSDCTTMSRPFDVRRDGSVLGEGAGAIVCETLEHAQSRGAPILGEIVGVGSSAVGTSQGSDHLRIAVENVLRAALGNTAPSSIGHINAHGLGTPGCDRHEATAIQNIFGPPATQPPVTTVKGHIGNLGAGSGMVELIASLGTLGDTLFPIRNCEQLDPACPIRACVTSDVPAGDSFVSLNVTPQGQASAVRVTRFVA
jgi:3-oxoacyl-[acyl-carrier-protein] synthase II